MFIDRLWPVRVVTGGDHFPPVQLARYEHRSAPTQELACPELHGCSYATKVLNVSMLIKLGSIEDDYDRGSDASSNIFTWLIPDRRSFWWWAALRHELTFTCPGSNCRGKPKMFEISNSVRESTTSVRTPAADFCGSIHTT